MFRFLASALLLSLAAPLPALAQDADGVMPDRPSPGIDARAWAAMMRNYPEQVKTNCWKLGCMVIINETSGYDVVGFYVDSASPGRSPRWSDNQMSNTLEPLKATLRFKNGGPKTCALPVRFVLRQRETHEKMDVNTTGSFCSTPHQDTVVRIKVLEGKVYVRGDDEVAPADTTH